MVKNIRIPTRRALANLVALLLLLAVCTSLSYAQQKQEPNDRLVEEFSFLIKDLKVDHQAEINNLNITISYRYISDIKESAYPDFRLLTKDIETFLANYPNETDYWEIVNKRLTALLLKKYPEIASITSEVKADPTRLDPYFRSSRVTRERAKANSKRDVR